MRIQNLNAPSVPRTIQPSSSGDAAQASITLPSDNAGQPELEIALLKAQIEHLELVVETARNLMSSNQEKLLRRLHDLPGEMVALSARLHRLNSATAVRRVA
jgi:hypothetical protein